MQPIRDYSDVVDEKTVWNGDKATVTLTNNSGSTIRVKLHKGTWLGYRYWNAAAKRLTLKPGATRTVTVRKLVQISVNSELGSGALSFPPKSD